MSIFSISSLLVIITCGIKKYHELKDISNINFILCL